VTQARPPSLRCSAMAEKPDLSRRGFLARGLAAASATMLGGCEESSDKRSAETMGKEVTLFVCGDVMLGRGIDQILPFPSEPTLSEPVASLAVDYVRYAESINGPISRPSPFGYVWGDALADLHAARPNATIVNLETSITKSKNPAPKLWNYKMSPANIDCIKVANVDCCVLANNHVLDWGVKGLLETLSTLEGKDVAVAGAGANRNEAAAPAIIDTDGDRRVVVYGFAATTSGVPGAWAATNTSPGVNLLPSLSRGTAVKVARRIAASRRRDDIVVVSIHWGSNWGYRVDKRHRAFAHTLIDAGACDLLHGHSSHHPLGIEIYRGRPILYGCGDFINDYEGSGMEDYERYRGDLSIGYLVRFGNDRALTELALLPYQMRRFQLHSASEIDIAWLQSTLDRESMRFGTRIILRGSQLNIVPQ